MTCAPFAPSCRRLMAVTLLAALMAAGCSSGDSSGDDTATTTSDTSATSAPSPTTAAGDSTDGGSVTASTELCLALSDQLDAQDDIIDNTDPANVESLATTAREANDALNEAAAGNDQAGVLVDATNSLLDALEAADFDATAVIGDLQATMTDPGYIAALQDLSGACATQP